MNSYTIQIKTRYWEMYCENNFRRGCQKCNVCYCTKFEDVSLCDSILYPEQPPCPYPCTHGFACPCVASVLQPTQLYIILKPLLLCQDMSIHLWGGVGFFNRPTRIFFMKMPLPHLKLQSISALTPHELIYASQQTNYTYNNYRLKRLLLH